MSTMHTMTTRQGSIRDLEARLKLTLQKLESTNNINCKLLLEREESELEINNVIDRNTKLKSELRSMNTELDDLRDQQQCLQTIVDTHSQCENMLENAFEQIKTLQKQLSESHRTIEKMQNSISQQNKTKTLALYDQLVIKEPVMTIDLASFCDDGNDKILTQKCRKRKKYRVRRRNRKQNINNNNTKHKNTLILGLRNEKVKLYRELGDYEYLVHRYEQDYADNMEKINRLEYDLQNMNYKYALAQSEIKERIGAIDELLMLSTYNLEQVELMENNNLNEDWTKGISQPLTASFPYSHDKETVIENSQKSALAVNNESYYLSNKDSNTTVKVFCDSVGVDFGSILVNHTDRSVINNCMSNTSYRHLISKVLNETHDKGTDIVIMMGDSSSVTKKLLIQSIEKLVLLQSLGNINKMVICALPYSCHLTADQNRNIHDLNIILYNLITCNSYDNKLIFFDINKYVYNFILTPIRMNLSKKQKHVIASLLLHILQQDIKIYYGLKCIRLTNTTKGGPCTAVSAVDRSIQAPPHDIARSESVKSLNI